jgi:pseudouridine kinase
MNNKNFITILGGSNMDLIAYPKTKLIAKDANIGHLEMIHGGVGRNIAENLSRLDFQVNFLSVFGDDAFGEELITACNAVGMNTSGSIQVKNHKNASFIAIMNHQNDLELGISAMEIYDHVPLDLVDANSALISQSDYCVLDTNMPKEILKHITEKHPNKRFALDAVSGIKALKAKGILAKIRILKVNLLEAELLSNTKVKSSDYTDLIHYFLDKGVQKVFITLGSKGVVFGTKDYIKQLAINAIKAVNTSGAGDAFMAGLVYGDYHDFDILKTVQFAQACARLTIQHKNTVHPDLNAAIILGSIKN